MVFHWGKPSHRALWKTNRGWNLSTRLHYSWLSMPASPYRIARAYWTRWASWTCRWTSRAHRWASCRTNWANCRTSWARHWANWAWATNHRTCRTYCRTNIAWTKARRRGLYLWAQPSLCHPNYRRCCTPCNPCCYLNLHCRKAQGSTQQNSISHIPSKSKNDQAISHQKRAHASLPRDRHREYSPSSHRRGGQCSKEH